VAGLCQQTEKYFQPPAVHHVRCNGDATGCIRAIGTAALIAVRPLNLIRELMPHITKAIILAAGPGSRLLPHTAHSPKCLTPIGGQPILRYQLAALRRCGVDDVVIVVGYLSDRIRDYVDSSVTLVENRDFASTNSSYSLWLARNHMRQGFIHLNSDLLFEPELLRALLASPDENAVIVDRRVRAGSDMMKAQMDGARILRMGKQLTTDAAAEVVGPAKFGASGAELVVQRLSQLRAVGDRNQWAYGVFGELAPQLLFAGVDNPGCFWAEVDTTADAADANRRIPASMVELASRSLFAGRDDATPPRAARDSAAL
jgi:choline kinase